MLKQANMVKRMAASGGGSLEAQNGESLRVRRIECIASANDTYLTISVDRVTVAIYRVAGKSGNHLGSILTAYLKANLMEFMESVGLDVSIPIASGQTLTVSRYAEAGNVMVLYDRHDEGDVKATDPNGSAGKEYTFVQYAKVGTAPTATGDALIDSALSPAEFPDFPCGKVVPANTEISLLGIVGCPFSDGAAGPVGFASTYLKLIKDREVLIDPDRLGIPFDGQDAAATALQYASNFSLIGPCTPTLLNTNVIAGGNPMMFDPPLAFGPGEELSAYLSVIKTGAATWTDNVDDQAFLLKVKKM